MSSELSDESDVSEVSEDTSVRSGFEPDSEVSSSLERGWPERLRSVRQEGCAIARQVGIWTCNLMGVACTLQKQKLFQSANLGYEIIP